MAAATPLWDSASRCVTMSFCGPSSAARGRRNCPSQVHRNGPPQQGPDALVHRAGRLRLHVPGGHLDPQHIGGVDLRDQPEADTGEGIAFEAGIQFCAYHRSREPHASVRARARCSRRQSERPPRDAPPKAGRHRTGPASGWRGLFAGRGERDESGRADGRDRAVPLGASGAKRVRHRAEGLGARRAQRERRRQGHEEHEERDEQQEDDGRKGTKGNERVRGAGRDHVQERGRVGSARCRR